MLSKSVINLDFIKELRMKNGIFNEERSVQFRYEGYQGYYYKERENRKICVKDIGEIF